MGQVLQTFETLANGTVHGGLDERAVLVLDWRQQRLADQRSHGCRQRQPALSRQAPHLTADVGLQVGGHHQATAAALWPAHVCTPTRRGQPWRRPEWGVGSDRLAGRRVADRLCD